MASASTSGLDLGIMHQAVDQNGLELSLFFERHVDPDGVTIIPRGAIVDRAGRNISSVVLKRDGSPVAAGAVGLASPGMGKLFPNYPNSAQCGFRIDIELTQFGTRTYSLVANIDGHGEIEIARPSIYSTNWKGKLDLQKERRQNPDIVEEEFWELLPTIWGRTNLQVPRLYNLYSALIYVLRYKIPGDFIECGVFMGGCVMMMAELCKRHDAAGSRRVYALDTFEGFTNLDAELDVDAATGKIMTNAPFQDFFARSSANMESVGFERLSIVKGDVFETIPKLDVGKIAILRLDTDTYDTTRFELEQLYDRVSPGGVTIIDDYGYTIGCRKAVDDFSSTRSIFPQRIDRACRTWVKSEVETPRTPVS